ncbi:amidohydrolase family protein [Vitiosangium sp. GDMCC 1.1324]|uniref:amidohydrolase family protein n=1 Tax=Vitiosangium sp. (strain GDMCC 1.1324) TaxID=2138576 RepID=UPI000D37E32C|nr:amidohydrolase family protein [Vitiosangium sp. GDMCC 1.1324]PTL83560.1 amidohydrolase [Vitiosangium sp. GDMCC 1.1324]
MAHPDDSPVCLGAAAGWLAPGSSTLPLPALNDEEGPRLPEGLPPVVDAHVHLFPDGVFEAVWRWFDQYGWPIRYKLHTPQVVSFLLSRGVHRVVALHYAHKPGMARFLNAYVAEVARAEPRVLGLATVLPGEEGAAEILAEAFAAGLKGVKLHCHVQCFAPDAPALHEVYAACARAGRPLVMHAGREPASPQYKCDVHALCSAERVERVLKDHPTLKLCIPHLGADEFDAYERLLERYDNLWLDTTMAVAGYFPIPLPLRLLHVRPERILYGTDFPNLPYAWDRELKQLLALKLGDEVEAGILGQNALGLFDGC